MNYKRITVASLPHKENSIETWWWFFEAITVIDGDRDGDLDILVGMSGKGWDPISSTDPKPFFIENKSIDRFVLNGIPIAQNLIAGWINNIVVGDFNSDGFDDAFLVDHGREDKPYKDRDFGPLNLLLSSKTDISLSTLKFETLSTWTKPNLDFWHGAINTRDYNLDGHLDIVATALGRAGVQLWFGDGRGSFKLSPEGTLPDYINRTTSLNGNWLSFGITGFIDSGGDGKADIFVLPYGLSNENSAGFIVLNSLSDGNTQKVINLGDLAVDGAINNNLNRGYSEAVVADFDGNGLEDIIALAEAANGKDDGEMFFMFLSQVSPNVFKDVTLESFGSYSSKFSAVKPRGGAYPDLFINSPSTEFYVADYNADGYLDINLGFAHSGEWGEIEKTIFLNDGKGKFSRIFELPITFHIAKGASIKTSGVGDLNSDGIGDFFVVESEYVNGQPIDNLVLLISDSVNSGSTRHFVMSESSSEVRGSDSNDIFTSIGGGSHKILGYVGIDTVRYTGNFGSFAVRKSSDQEFYVNKPDQFSSTDRLIGIERITFSDTSVAIDIYGNAGIVAKILGAVFGKDFISNKQYVGIGLHYIDNGMSYEELAKLAVNAKIGLKATSSDIVSLVYSNVVGSAPPQGAPLHYASLLDSGKKTIEEIVMLGSEHPLNALNIDLVGLASTGIEYIPFD